MPVVGEWYGCSCAQPWAEMHVGSINLQPVFGCGCTGLCRQLAVCLGYSYVGQADSSAGREAKASES
jgi:hypothetical protein